MNDSFITPLLLFSILPSFSTYPIFGHFCLINQKYDNLAYLVKKLWLSLYIMMDNILRDYWDVSMQLDITVCKLWCTIIKYQWWCCGCILCFLWLRVYWTRLVCNMFYDCGILVASALPTDGNNPKNLKPDDDFVNLFSNAWCARWKTRSSQNIWCNCFF